MYRIKCSCGDAECSAEMEITERFDEEENIEILIYNGGLPNSIYMDKKHDCRLKKISCNDFDETEERKRRRVRVLLA